MAGRTMAWTGSTGERRASVVLLRSVAAAVAAMGVVGAADAQTLRETLTRAYETNPTIQAERARQRATREAGPQAWADALPQVTASGSYESSDFETVSVIGATSGGTETVTTDGTLDTLSADVRADLVVFNGLRNVNTIREARARIEAGGAQLAGVEQDVLTRAAGVYFDVSRDMSVYQANVQNVSVLTRRLEEAQLRFRVGDVTRTDVAQAEARLARARADLSAAQAQLAVSRAQFAELTGDMPIELEKEPELPETPETLDAAIALARALSPVVVAARAAEKASHRQIAIAKSAFSPEVALTSRYQYAEDPNFFVQTDEQFVYGVRATVPIFQGGRNFSRVREARALNDADRRRVVEAERRAEAEVIASWEQLAAARATIVSAQAQIDATKLALDGVQLEAQLGARTTLDVLDAEQEYLNAQVAFARATRDAGAATFAVLASAGVLLANDSLALQDDAPSEDD